MQLGLSATAAADSAAISKEGHSTIHTGTHRRQGRPPPLAGSAGQPPCMMQQATFSGWDFTNTWGIVEGVTYPYLLGSSLSMPAIQINSVSQLEGNSGTTNMNFTVTLSSTSGQAVTVVPYATSNGTAISGSDYAATSATLSIGAGRPAGPSRSRYSGIRCMSRTSLHPEPKQPHQCNDWDWAGRWNHPERRPNPDGIDFGRDGLGRQQRHHGLRVPRRPHEHELPDHLRAIRDGAWDRDTFNVRWLWLCAGPEL